MLEVGVGTGINLSLYPRDCAVTGIDFSGSMLEKARERAARKELRNIRLLQMDAADLKFADNSFDIVYAPYLISVVPDPVKVAREMRRVCRPGGRIIFLNHFLSPNPILSRIERLISPVHDSHRLQGGSRPAGVSRAGGSAAGVDREGEHPADLVARHVRQGLSRPFWLALVIAAFCLPLFIGLGRTDLENDEAIYSFAVDGILANGDWLNPQASPDDNNVFLEKPPLKFWIVAAPIRLGPAAARRVRPALLGRAVRRASRSSTSSRSAAGSAGPVCGAIAVMVLFVYGPLLFEHGLRGNNMEAPLFLCYCGGVYHYLAWAAGDVGACTTLARSWPWRCIFYLGFMTKFVAALFLPVFLGVAALSLAETRSRLRQDFVVWIGAALLFLALAAPWFVYQYLREGEAVLARDPAGARATPGSRPRSTRRTCSRGTSTTGRCSTSSSTWACCGWSPSAPCCCASRRCKRSSGPDRYRHRVVRGADGPDVDRHVEASPLRVSVPAAARARGRVRPRRGCCARRAAGYDAMMQALQAKLTAPRRWSNSVRNTFAVLACLALALAVLTFVLGGVTWKVGGVTIFRNAHVARPLLVALILGTLAGRGVVAARLVLPVAILLLLLPANAYEDTWRQTRERNQPLHVARDCLMRVHDAEAAGREAPARVYAVGEHKWFLHSYYYYLRHAGVGSARYRWIRMSCRTALFVQGHQRPVLLGESDYRAFKAQHVAEVQSVPALPLRESLLLMPGPYAVCAPRKPNLSPFH